MGHAEQVQPEVEGLNLQLRNDIAAYNAEVAGKKLTPTEKIFGELLQRAVETRRKGNYGIAALYTFTLKGMRINVYGQNGLVTRGLPGAHAERDAIQRAAKLIHIPDDRRQEYFDSLVRVGLVTHHADTEEDPGTIYTSLEPCGGCKADIITGGIPREVSAIADPGAGEMHDGRFEQYTGEVFTWIANSNGLERILCQKDFPDKPYYVSPQLEGLLYRTFYDTKQPLDQHLVAHPMMNPTSLLSLRLFRS